MLTDTLRCEALGDYEAPIPARGARHNESHDHRADRLLVRGWLGALCAVISVNAC